MLFELMEVHLFNAHIGCNICTFLRLFEIQLKIIIGVLKIVGPLICDSCDAFYSTSFSLTWVCLFFLLCHWLRTYVWQGGAGTWSDGKLVTRIGRNSGSVLAVSSFPYVVFMKLICASCVCVKLIYFSCRYIKKTVLTDKWFISTHFFYLKIRYNNNLWWL